ncbi:MAG: hydroxylamine reductase [Candidatus Hydrogenedentes bacterium]|nr:hydroxylamine reductase [Candidatus Hydrogenedentota bacterium]
MFCFQCEQTAGGEGCTTKGVCGKDPDTAALQDLLVYAAKGIAQYAHRARKLGASDREIDVFVIEALFTTVTNVNFDPDRVAQLIRRAAKIRDKAKDLYEGAAAAAGQRPQQLEGPAAVDLSGNLDALIAQGVEQTIQLRFSALGPDVTGLQELITYGLKGSAAYADHALVLGAEKDEIYAGFHEVLDYLAEDPSDVGELTATALKVGDLNLKVMELLDKANTGTYGHPEPTQVRITPVQGKCILVSGHDLKDLEELLKQTEGKGVNVYTHGEMLPGLAYPGLKKFKHLVGNYGGAWQEQIVEFNEFPGAILMTTNCILAPKKDYQDRIFTTGLVAWPGVKHVPNGDFSSVIEAALEAPGFEEDAPEEFITVGFAHNAVLGVADKIIEAVKGGAIRHFFLIGGCDGARRGRNYFTELAEKVPEDCVILTLGCGKYRFNKLDFGDIGGIPRLLDVGQCNDAYSAVRIAQALADAFDCGVNDLPLSFVLSWFEQKAVAILLSLLNLGIKNIRLGPTLPAFVTPAVLDVLVENFDLKPTATAEEDMQAMLAAGSPAEEKVGSRPQTRSGHETLA